MRMTMWNCKLRREELRMGGMEVQICEIGFTSLEREKSKEIFEF